jgi:hypothetical protein
MESFGGSWLKKGWPKDVEARFQGYATTRDWTGDVSGMGKIRLALVPKRTVQPSSFMMIKCGGHHDNISPQRKGRKIWQKQIRPHGLYIWEMF